MYTEPGGYGQNQSPYGSNGSPCGGYTPYGAPEPWLVGAKKREKGALFFQGLLGGGALLCTIGVQYIIIFIMMALNVYETKYLTDSIFQYGVDIITTLLSILLPFLLFGKALQKRSQIAELLPLGAPKKKSLFFLAIPAGMGLCMVANIATSYLTTFASAAGVELSSPELAMPGGFLGILTAFCRVAVVAAVVEELAFRGVIMQNLRPFGDGFAIVMSAIVFAFMHGNLVQAPFALIAGCALGYIAIKTGSLWTSIVVHALNNSISLIISYLGQSMEKEALTILSAVIIYGLIIIGVPCFIAFAVKTNRGSEPRPSRTLTSGPAKSLAYLSAPTMIVVVIIMLYTTSKFVSLR